ncbi:MAG: response regulator [Pseudomonadota bacterium]
MHHPQKVLLVEDNEDDQYIGRYVIKKQWPHAQIVVAKDGLHAIEVLEEAGMKPPDLILLDINMPRMDGHEFLAAWYGERGLHIPVVVILTSSEQAQDKQRTSQYSCVSDYLIKPLTQDNLATMRWAS